MQILIRNTKEVLAARDVIMAGWDNKAIAFAQNAITMYLINPEYLVTAYFVRIVTSGWFAKIQITISIY
jgi:hypothetical protein